MDIYPLMINCIGFHVGGTSWSRHREKFPGSSMIDFLRMRFCRLLRKEEILNRFFYSESNLTILEERKVHHEWSKQDHRSHRHLA
jgi:hypothetical protein